MKATDEAHFDKSDSNQALKYVLDVELNPLSTLSYVINHVILAYGEKKK